MITTSVVHFRDEHLEVLKENNPDLFNKRRESCLAVTMVTVNPENPAKPGQVFDGFAFCGEKDNFNKKLGVTIARGRAIAQSHGRFYDYTGSDIKTPFDD
jgi:hypothetical protein